MIALFAAAPLPGLPDDGAALASQQFQAAEANLIAYGLAVIAIAAFAAVIGIFRSRV